MVDVEVEMAKFGMTSGVLDVDDVVVVFVGVVVVVVAQICVKSTAIQCLVCIHNLIYRTPDNYSVAIIDITHIYFVMYMYSEPWICTCSCTHMALQPSSSPYIYIYIYSTALYCIKLYIVNTGIRFTVTSINNV